MKSIQFTKRVATKQTKYKLSDINNSLFYNTQPVIYIRPFSDVKDPILSKVTIECNLIIYDKGEKLIHSLARSIKGDFVTNLDRLNKLPHWILIKIYEKYKEEFDEWINYIFDNMQKFCEEDSESIINWSLVEHGGIKNLFTEKLSFEQKMWISLCSRKDKSDWVNFIVKIKDSLLPWLNLGMYQKMQDKEENTRTNAAYEEQRKKLLEGKLEDLDTIE